MENYYNSWFGGSENNTTDSSYGYDMYDMYHITYDSEGYVLHIDNPVDNNESKAISIEDKKLDSSTPLFIVSSFSNVVELTLIRKILSRTKASKDIIIDKCKEIYYVPYIWENTPIDSFFRKEQNTSPDKFSFVSIINFIASERLLLNTLSYIDSLLPGYDRVESILYKKDKDNKFTKISPPHKVWIYLIKDKVYKDIKEMKYETK